MFYCILGIIVGILLLIHSLFLFFGKKGKLGIYCLCFVCSIGLIGSGIGGFFIPKELEYITILLLLGISIVYLVIYTIFLKEGKKSQQGKIASRK